MWHDRRWPALRVSTTSKRRSGLTFVVLLSDGLNALRVSLPVFCRTLGRRHATLLTQYVVGSPVLGSTCTQRSSHNSIMLRSLEHVTGKRAPTCKSVQS